MIDELSGELVIDCDLTIINKLNEVISEVNNITNNCRVFCEVVGRLDDKCKVGFDRRCCALPCTLTKGVTNE